MTSENPYLRRQQHRIGKSGTKSEKRLSKDLGARLRPASGAMEGAKGDMTLGECLIEAKSTINATIGLKHSWLSKIGTEARSEGKTPALIVSFITPDGTPIIDGEWALIPLHKFKELSDGD
jgi:hypothetical protein